MEPVFKILGVDTLAYWRGQPSVCQHCLIKGHWTSECTPELRAQTFVKKQNQIPPIPIPSPQEIQPTLTPPTQPPTQQPTQPPTQQPTQQPAKTPTATTTAVETPKPVTPGIGKKGFRFQEPPRQKDRITPE